MVNRRDVARYANVSTATVSNVLNNTKYVSPELKSKVFKAAQDLNYTTPTQKLGSKSKSNEVVFVVNDASNPHHGDILTGMDEVARKYNYVVSLMVIWSDIGEFCRMLINRHISAVFFTTFHHEFTPKYADMLTDAGIDVIYSWDNFIIDFDDMVLKAVRYLADLGHKRVAYLSGLSISDPNNIRYAAYQKAIRLCNLDNDPELSIDGIYPYETTIQSGYWAMKTTLDRNTQFTSVITLNDLMAIGAMRAIYEKGMKIPDDISIIGCDDITMSEYLMPPLTTLKIPAKEIGIRTMYDIIQKKNGRPTYPVHMAMELITRKSTGLAKK